MPEKTATTGMTRAPAPVLDKSGANGNTAANLSGSRLIKLQRMEQKRLDRYGRFGRR
jgi:hypothetical protein